MPPEAGAIEHHVRGEQALVVRHLGLQRVQVTEAALESLERNCPANGLQPAARLFGIAAVEVPSEPLIGRASATFDAPGPPHRRSRAPGRIVRQAGRLQS